MASRFVDLSFLSSQEDFDANDFDFTVSVHAVVSGKKNISINSNILKKYSESIPNFKYVQKLDGHDKYCILVPTNESKNIWLNSAKKSLIEYIDVVEVPVKLGIDNFSIDELFSIFIPKDLPNPSGFETVGHIAHLNLNDHYKDFKFKIGKIILLKVSNIKTVINKVSSINNVFRNLSFEVLAGKNSFVVNLTQHNCKFEFDYSKVYWNSKLETAHKLVVESLPHESLLLDITCGVGPFAIPAAKNRMCIVIANDLNPYCCEYLKKNAEINKVRSRICCYNLDGHELIARIFRTIGNGEKIVTLEGNEILQFPKIIHIVLNLPELSLTFLPSIYDALQNFVVGIKLIIYCFFFHKCVCAIDWLEVDSKVYNSIPTAMIVNRKEIRKVSPNKHMILYVIEC